MATEPEPQSGEDARQELAEYAALLTPAVAAVLAAAAEVGIAKAAAPPTLKAAEAAAQGLGIASMAGGALLQVATRALQKMRKAVPLPLQPNLWQEQSPAAQAGRDAGLQVLTNTAARVIHETAQEAHAARNAPHAVSPRGEAPSKPPPAVPSATKIAADALNQRTAQTARATALATREAAKYEAATRAGWTHKTWLNVGDAKVRPTHVVLGERAWPDHKVPINETFTSPGGAELRFPGDPTAPLDETKNCRCYLLLTVDL